MTAIAAKERYHALGKWLAYMDREEQHLFQKLLALFCGLIVGQLNARVVRLSDLMSDQNAESFRACADKFVCAVQRVDLDGLFALPAADLRNRVQVLWIGTFLKCFNNGSDLDRDIMWLVESTLVKVAQYQSLKEAAFGWRNLARIEWTRDSAEERKRQKILQEEASAFRRILADGGYQTGMFLLAQ